MELQKVVIVYIDVDGVINSLGIAPFKELSGWHGDWSEAPVEDLRILWSRELIEALNRLSALEHVIFKWVTTWEEDTRILPDLMGLNSQGWDVIKAFSKADHHSRANGWWKFQAIQRDFVAEQPAKIVWIDDELVKDLGSRIWIEALNDIGQGFGISPEGHVGLTRADMEQLEAMISNVTANF